MLRRQYFLCLLLVACVFILITGLCWKKPATRSSMLFPANGILDMTGTANSRLEYALIASVYINNYHHLYFNVALKAQVGMLQNAPPPSQCQTN